MLPCASHEKGMDAEHVAGILLFGQQSALHRRETPIKILCLHEENFPLNGLTTTRTILAHLRIFTRPSDAADQYVQRDVVSMTIDYDIVPNADSSGWHYTIKGTIDGESYPYTIATRAIDVLREAMQREGEDLPTDPPGDSLCRISGQVAIELDVLSASDDMLRYGRLCARRIHKKV
jgi:hypothetical protein